MSLGNRRPTEPGQGVKVGEQGKKEKVKEKRTHITIDPDAWIELEADTEGVTLTCHDERVTSHVKLTWKKAAEVTKFIRKANFERMGDT